MEHASWQIRRARLVDVPAVARLLGAPAPQQWRTRTGVSARTMTSATRLLLTHVGLEHDRFWVAVGGGQIRGAVVLLPPATDAVQRRLLATLRLELGLGLSALADPVVDRAGDPAVPDGAWLMLAAPTPAREAVLRDLLAVALRGADDAGQAVVCIQPDLPEAVLAEAGFERAGSAHQVRPARAPLPL